MTACPNCTVTVVAVAAPDWQTPPSVCTNCNRGWWDSELTPAVVTKWDKGTQSWPTKVAATVVAAAEAEHKAKTPPKGDSHGN